jgi:exodeoxyribonuclease VII large subunit
MQLNRIRLLRRHFDAVAIILGGGGEVGLTCFNHYSLASCIASFPLPVYTGIGHATNETVSELVAYFNGITPTKVAEHILSQFESFEQTINSAKRILVDFTTQLSIESHRDINRTGNRLHQASLRNTQSRLETLGHLQTRIMQGNRYYAREALAKLNQLNTDIRQAQSDFLAEQLAALSHNMECLIQSSQQLFENQATLLNVNERLVNMLDPKNTLKRGYSITLKNGKAVTTFDELNIGDKLETLVYKGKIESIVNATQAES